MKKKQGYMKLLISNSQRKINDIVNTLQFLQSVTSMNQGGEGHDVFVKRKKLITC